MRYVHQRDHRGTTHARNLGVTVTKGDAVVFLDDDLEPPPDFLEKLLEPLRALPEVGGAGGVAVHPRPPTWLRRAFLRVFHRHAFRQLAYLYETAPAEQAFVPVTGLSGGVAVYRRAVLDRFAFDENLRNYCPGEDMEYSYRVSREFPLVLATAARANHLSLGWSGFALTVRFERKILAFAYHHYKNLRGQRRSGLAFAWLMTGILCEALIDCAKWRSVEPAVGFAHGLRWVLFGMDGARGLVDKDPRRLTEEERLGVRGG